MFIVEEQSDCLVRLEASHADADCCASPDAFPVEPGIRQDQCAVFSGAQSEPPVAFSDPWTAVTW
jgi:hypothetical protein